MTHLKRSNRLRRAAPFRIKSVYVHPYTRYRFGRWEDVCQHFRSPPQQLTFDF